MKRSLLLGVLVLAHSLSHAQTAPSDSAPNVPLPPGMIRIFNGSNLDGWVLEPMNATTFSGSDITNVDVLSTKLIDKPDAVATYVSEQLDEPAQQALTRRAPSTNSTRELRSTLSKSLTKIVSGSCIHDAARFKAVRLRPETHELLKASPSGRDLARLNRLLLEDAFPDELWQSPPVAWTVRNGVLASLGAGRGVIYTRQSFDRYRVIFDVRHVSGNPDHRAGVLVFCTAPTDGEQPLDALAGIQFQVPNGGSWDYRKGKNNGGKGLFTRLVKPNFDEHQWSRVEILADPATGTGRMAVAQPPGAKAIEVLRFIDPTAGRKGPFALQMHNRGLFDEYANIAIEETPAADELITTK